MSTLSNSTHRALARTVSTLAVLGLVATVGCSNDGTTAPATPPVELRKEIVDPAIVSPILQRSKSIKVNKTFRFKVDEKGGWFGIGDAGLYIHVPENAVRGPVTLTAQALPGSLMAYEFGPHGTTFDVPLEMYQDLSLANVTGKDLAKFEVGYFADETTLDFWNKKVAVNEFIPTGIVLEGRAVRFEVSHFSGYVIATGRGSTDGLSR